MKFYSGYLFLLFVLASCSRLPVAEVSRPGDHVYYAVDYQSADNNTFQVTISTPLLSQANNIFQFASTAPGTYQVMDIGRFVSNFKVFDTKGDAVNFTKISTNQYKIANPEKVRSIQYTMAETWDTKVDKHKVYRMCGTSIEKDHVLFNAHCVLGYIKGLQAMPIQLRLPAKADWETGTALETTTTGAYIARNFDHLVDSPILMGRLSSARTDVNGTAVDIFTYSHTGKIQSSMILESMQSMLEASDLFLEGLPVDRYTFLFHFENTDHGAWEHSYSSEYVYQEYDWDEIEERIMATASHEFFHVVTPLNIHSEIIEQFNFVDPTPSQHLWLYEGVTEWASDMILVHGGVIDEHEFLDRIQEKLVTGKQIYGEFDISLTDLALTSYTAEGQKQYGNIYQIGAVIISLLDLKLLELSDGQKGLRNLIVELAKDYGPEKPFNETTFFDEIVARTYPEIGLFFDKYIKGTEPLPIAEYYKIIGVDYHEKTIDSTKSGMGINYFSGNQGIYVMEEPKNEGASALQYGDIISTINGIPLNRYSIEEFLNTFELLTIGTPYAVELLRNGQTKSVECKTVAKEEAHVFTLSESATEKQLALRQQWMGR